LNGKEYARLIETPYQNLMLDKQVLKTKKKTCGAQVIFTTRSGITWRIDGGSLEKAQF
jgi:hypothetical protein